MTDRTPSTARPDPPRLVTGPPVPDFPIKFTWQGGDWEKIFNRLIDQIKEDIARARSEDKLIVYLSCPISARGGGMSTTNTEIASVTTRHLMDHWGTRIWVLNPSAYQLESKQGTGLIKRFARELEISEERLNELKTRYPAKDGDYMRMWTRILVEDDDRKAGDYFSAYYFLGPTDVHRFFGQSDPITLTTAIENYFAQQYAINAEFRDFFSPPSALEWQKRRDAFVRFYALRASAAYSRGSHDEWNILVRLNSRRLALREADGYGMGSQIPAYFNGRQVPPGAAEAPITPGYEVI